MEVKEVMEVMKVMEMSYVVPVPSNLYVAPVN